MRQDIKIPAGGPGQEEFCYLGANYRGRGSHTIVVPKSEYYGTDRLERVAGGGSDTLCGIRLASSMRLSG